MNTEEPKAGPQARPAPFDREGDFFRGNLHCHSNRSDGALEPGKVIEVYKGLGYDFICLSDHFNEEYDWPIVDTSPWRDGSFTTLIGAEVANPGPGTWRGKYSMAAVGLPFDFAPVVETETGPEIAARAQQAGAFVSLCHPGYHSLGLTEVEGLAEHLDAVELYNDGVQRANARGDAWFLFEQLLDEGRELFCIASDDAHFQFGAYNAVGGAWIHARSSLLDPDSLLRALKEGAFFSTTGPSIDDIFVESGEVHVQCSPAAVVSLTGPSWLQRHVAHRTWDGKPPDVEASYGTIDESDRGGISRCRLPLVKLGAKITEESEGEWAPGDWWRVTVTDAEGRRAWSNPSRLRA